MAAILYALLTSALWGISDYLGGNASRKVAPVVLALVAQIVGLVAALAIWGAVHRGLDQRALAFALAAGVVGSVGLVLLYEAFSRGLLSIVAPIVALSAIVPVVISLIGGERPPPVALLGALIALGGAALAARGEIAHQDVDPQASKALGWALGSALLFGGSLYLLGRSGKEADAIASIVGVRIVAVPLLLLVCAIRRPSFAGVRANWFALVVVGLTDILANLCLALASERGLLSLVSVLSSLYPVVVIALAHRLLGERITRSQYAGVGATLVGVALIGAASA